MPLREKLLSMTMKAAKVYLVGAGPGDPGLITLRGLECLRQADVIIYDNLCNPLLLRHASRRAKIIFAGKHSGLQTLSQRKIEHHMIRYATSGKVVVRLKGGDPFVFGRGGEEAARLHDAGVLFEIVPGVTSAIAAPAYAGIPVTHRDHASGVAVVTAYEDPDKPESLLDFHALARFPGTLLVLMGVKRLPPFLERLTRCGKPSSTPVALIRWGTRGFQQVLTGTVGNMGEKCEKTNFRPPAVAVIGDVVRCREKLRWFEKKPLFGKRIVVTRTRDQSGTLTSQLIDLGAEVLELPTIEIQKVRSPQVRKMASNAASWDWVIFASPWAVDFFLEEIRLRHGDLSPLKRTRFAVVGPGTQTHLKENGLRADLMPRVHTAKGLAQTIRSNSKKFLNKNVLIPRSEIGRDEVLKAMKQVKANAQAVTIYQNKLPKLGWEILALERFGADTLTFTSSSTVTHFVRLLRKPGIFSNSLRRTLMSCKWISIGPATSETIRKHGFRVHREARKHDLSGLIQAIRKTVSR